MNDELAILHLVAERLESAGIAYMVTGSMALSVYAEPRMTRDVDLVIELAPSQADVFGELFRADFLLDQDRVQESIRRGGMFNMIHTTSVVKVDCVVRKDSPYRHTEFGRRRRLQLAGRTVDLVAPEDLLLSKLDWARDSRSDIQLRDARTLAAAPGLDWDYLNAWAAQLGLTNLLAEVRA